MIYIEGNPFAYCPELTDIYYGGTENKWYVAAADIAWENNVLLNVTLHFAVTGLSKDNPVKEAGKDEVEAAILFNDGNTAPIIYIKGTSASISEEGLESVKEFNTPIILQTDNYSLTIRPEDIKTASDFSVVVKSADNTDNIGQWTDSSALMIIPEQPSKGDFGMTVRLTVPESSLPFNVNSSPYLYHVDDSNNIEDYSNYLSYGEGAVSVTLSHASKYFITPVKVNGANPDPNPVPSATDSLGFVIPNVTTAVNTTVPATNTSNSGNSEFSIEFEAETEQTTVTAAESTPVEAQTTSNASTTTPPPESNVSINTTYPETTTTANTSPIGNTSGNSIKDDKPLNTGERSISLSPIMLISAAAVFGGTFLSVKKNKDK